MLGSIIRRLGSDLLLPGANPVEGDFFGYGFGEFPGVF